MRNLCRGMRARALCLAAAPLLRAQALCRALEAGRRHWAPLFSQLLRGALLIVIGLTMQGVVKTLKPLLNPAAPCDGPK